MGHRTAGRDRAGDRCGAWRGLIARSDRRGGRAGDDRVRGRALVRRSDALTTPWSPKRWRISGRQNDERVRPGRHAGSAPRACDVTSPRRSRERWAELRREVSVAGCPVKGTREWYGIHRKPCFSIFTQYDEPEMPTATHETRRTERATWSTTYAERHLVPRAVRCSGRYVVCGHVATAEQCRHESAEEWSRDWPQSEVALIDGRSAQRGYPYRSSRTICPRLRLQARCPQQSRSNK